jgi:AraC-like DNA-binding protein
MIEFILLLLGSAHGFYLSFALLTKNNKDNNTNLLLALFVFALALRLSFMVVDVGGFFDLIPHLIELDAPIAFLFGPLLFLYVKKLTSPSFYKVNFLHFLPFILAIVISLPFYWQGTEFKLAWLLDVPTTELGLWYLNLFEIIFIPMKLVLLAIYMVFVYQRLVQYRGDITDNFSNVEKINLTWLIRLFSALGLLFLCWVFNEVIEFYLEFCLGNEIGFSCGTLEAASENLRQLTEYGMVICFYSISIYGLKQPAIFTVNVHSTGVKKRIELSIPQKVEGITETQDQQVIIDKKYQKSSLTEQLSIKVFQELNRFVTEYHLYLDPELSLSQLALESGFSKHHLSQAINQCTNKTFFDFINCLRVEHAKSLLHAENGMNVLEVSLAAGFNSRSAFYKAFKKHTQLTPSQFKKKRTVNLCPA